MSITPGATPQTQVSPTPVRPSSRNITIEGLRGFSAMLVVLAHVYNMAILSGILSAPITDIGVFGVSLFFCISGYVIVQSLIRHDNVGVFLKNRVIRIYPIFTVLTLIIFGVGPWTHYAWMGALRYSPTLLFKHFVSNMLLLPGVFRLPLAQQNAWSLSYEFAFYLIASLFYLAYLQQRCRPAGLILFLCAMALSYAFIFWHSQAEFFLVGVLLYFLRGYLEAPAIRWLWQGGTGLVYLALCYFCSARFFGISWLPGLLFFATVVTNQGLFSRFLRLQPLRFLGKISYSLYLIHPFTLEAIRILVKHLNQHLPNGMLWLAVFAILGIPLSIATATLSFVWIETRLTGRIFHCRTVRRSAPAVTAEALRNF